MPPTKVPIIADEQREVNLAVQSSEYLKKFFDTIRVFSDLTLLQDWVRLNTCGSMVRLKTAAILETASNKFELGHPLGEGASGRVFAASDELGNKFAIKILTNTPGNQWRNLKDDIGFLAKNVHPNIVSVVDHGVAKHRSQVNPFYVMRYYSGNLRQMIKRRWLLLNVMPKFKQILDGVEAAHLQGIFHQNLKPENILCEGETLAVTDFGIAQFTKVELSKWTEISPHKRLANFFYAAPEQRHADRHVDRTADIYALGLILNEMYTGGVAGASEWYGCLDQIVSVMIRQDPRERPQTIPDVRSLISRYIGVALTL